MSHQNGSANNPQIAVITYMEKKIIDSLDDAEYLKALRQIYALKNLIKEVHRDKDLMDKISKEYNSLNGSQNYEKMKKYAETNLFKYIDWFGEVMQILYAKGYLTDQGYQMVYPSELSSENRYISPLLQRP